MLGLSSSVDPTKNLAWDCCCSSKIATALLVCEHHASKLKHRGKTADTCSSNNIWTWEMNFLKHLQGKGHQHIRKKIELTTVHSWTIKNYCEFTSNKAPGATLPSKSSLRADACTKIDSGVRVDAHHSDFLAKSGTRKCVNMDRFTLFCTVWPRDDFVFYRAVEMNVFVHNAYATPTN